MKFNKKDTVVHLPTGKKCIVVGTMKNPYRPSTDFMNRKEIYPDEGYDYLVMMKKNKESENGEYLGSMSVNESQLNKL